MDWTLLSIGTLTIFWGILSLHLIWKEPNHTTQRQG